MIGQKKMRGKKLIALKIVTSVTKYPQPPAFITCIVHFCTQPVEFSHPWMGKGGGGA